MLSCLKSMKLRCTCLFFRSVRGIPFDAFSSTTAAPVMWTPSASWAWTASTSSRPRPSVPPSWTGRGRSPRRSSRRISRRTSSPDRKASQETPQPGSATHCCCCSCPHLTYVPVPGFRRPRVLPDQPSRRLETAAGVREPQVRGSPGLQDPSEVSVPAQPKAGVQLGKGRTQSRAPNVQGGRQRQDHRLRGRRNRWLGPGRARWGFSPMILISSWTGWAQPPNIIINAHWILKELLRW